MKCKHMHKDEPENAVCEDYSINTICGLTLTHIEWMKNSFIEKFIEIEEMKGGKNDRKNN